MRCAAAWRERRRRWWRRRMRECVCVSVCGCVCVYACVHVCVCVCVCMCCTLRAFPYTNTAMVLTPPWCPELPQATTLHMPHAAPSPVSRDCAVIAVWYMVVCSAMHALCTRLPRGALPSLLTAHAGTRPGGCAYVEPDVRVHSHTSSTCAPGSPTSTFVSSAPMASPCVIAGRSSSSTRACLTVSPSATQTTGTAARPSTALYICTCAPLCRPGVPAPRAQPGRHVVVELAHRRHRRRGHRHREGECGPVWQCGGVVVCAEFWSSVSSRALGYINSGL
jgi:hypothetical protein